MSGCRACIKVPVQPVLHGELRRQVSMADYSTWRAGGAAKQFYSPADRDDLSLFLRLLPLDEPVLWLGLGSNLLVRDGGFPGTVIFTRACLLEMRLLADGLLWVDAGVACAHVAKFCAEQGLVGAEFLAGIPGTMGGALTMNAGAFGGETWNAVVSVTTVDRQGAARERSVAEYQIGYRKAQGPEGEWFLGARLKLTPGETSQSRAQIRELLARRAATQPINLPSCGSVFRNPTGDYAARLIEASGLKGRCSGGACVSEMHANFIINSGAATASDIENLIELVQAEVLARHGVALQTEVCIVGDKPGVISD